MTSANRIASSAALAAFVYTASATTLPESAFASPKMRLPLALPNATPSQQWIHQAAAEQLRQFCDLTPNWDGYGALPLHEDTKANATLGLSIFKSFSRAPEIVPNSNGTVSFEWQTDAGEALMEIGRTRFVAIVRPVGSTEFTSSGSAEDHSELSYLAAMISASLFPKATQALTTTFYAAEYARSAA